MKLRLRKRYRAFGILNDNTPTLYFNRYDQNTKKMLMVSNHRKVRKDKSNYLFSRITKDKLIEKICKKCNHPVEEENELDYPFYCQNCDENLFEFETELIESQESGNT